MIAVLYSLFKKDQNKADLDKRRTEKWNVKLQTVEQRLEDPLNQSKEFSGESNLKLREKPYDKITEWQPIEMARVKWFKEAMMSYSLHSPYVKQITQKLYNSKSLERFGVSHLRIWPSTTKANMVCW